MWHVGSIYLIHFFFIHGYGRHFELSHHPIIFHSTFFLEFRIIFFPFVYTRSNDLGLFRTSPNLLLNLDASLFLGSSSPD